MAQQVGNVAQRSVLDDSYELHTTIGRGSDSIIYRAQLLPGAAEKLFQQGSDSSLLQAEEFAIKIITTLHENAPAAIERIQCEAEALAACAHPNVITLHDHKASTDCCYLVLEYAEHGNLQRILDDYPDPLTPERALKLTIQLLNGLEAVHRAGIIHRDIKPENILVTDRSTIKISDFSIALRPAERAQLGTAPYAVGTLEYAAPEFLMSGAVSEASDLYAVGVTLFQFLSKRLPFDGHTLSQQLNRKVGGLRHALPDSVLEQSELLDRLMEKALAPDRSKRFQTAREFRNAVEAVLASMQPGAHAPAARSRSAVTRGTIHRSGVGHGSAARFDGPRIVSSKNSAQLHSTQPVHSPTNTRSPNWNAHQLDRMRENRVRTKTNYQELRPFVRTNTGSSRFGSWRQIGIWSSLCVLAVGSAVALKVFDSAHFAMAALGSSSSISGSGDSGPVKQTFGRGVRDFFSSQSSNFSRVQPLTSGTHLGILRNLFSEAEHVPFLIQGTGAENRVLVTLGIPGFETKTIMLNPKARSGEIRIVGHGLDLSLHLAAQPKSGALDKPSENSVIRGEYRERLSGRTGSWSISLES